MLENSYDRAVLMAVRCPDHGPQVDKPERTNHCSTVSSIFTSKLHISQKQNHITWTVWTDAGIVEAQALVTIVTLRTVTYEIAVDAAAGSPLLAGVGIAQIQHSLE